MNENLFVVSCRALPKKNDDQEFIFYIETILNDSSGIYLVVDDLATNGNGMGFIFPLLPSQNGLRESFKRKRR